MKAQWIGVLGTGLVVVLVVLRLRAKHTPSVDLSARLDRDIDLGIARTDEGKAIGSMVGMYYGLCRICTWRGPDHWMHSQAQADLDAHVITPGHTDKLSPTATGSEV